MKIPTHNFMIIKVEDKGQLKMMAFLVHQDVESSEPLDPYLTSVREIEGLTGLNFNPLFQQAYADSIEGVVLESVW